LKFVLFVEGFTEKKALPEFFRRWLDSQLTQRVGIKIVRFDGWQDYVREIPKKVALNLSGKAGVDVIAGLGLLDLYGPTFYPNGVTVVADRYKWAKRQIEKTVNHPRFHQYLVVHDVEAWLLAEPDNLPPAVKTALPGGCVRPETVDFDEPPAYLLDRLYREKLGRPYRKVTDGAELFAALPPDVAGSKCPFLQTLLDDMVRLARAAAE
jgi:Domain of unknown function (DUF4276)